MKRAKLIPVILLIVLLTSFGIAQQDPVIDKIIKIGRIDNQVMRHLDHACNKIGGRSTGSDAYTNASKWAFDEFKKWGLEVELDFVDNEAVGFNRGPWFGKMISPEEKLLTFGTPSYTAGTKGKQQGHVVMFPENEEDLIKMKSKLKNAWVMLPDTSQGWPRGGRSGIEPPYVKILEEAGALGTIMYAPDPMRLLDNRNIKMWDWVPTLPDIKLTAKEFDEIKNLVKKGKEVILEFDIRNYFKKGPIPYHNVIAWIPGTTYPDEYVIIGGHLDCYDCATGAVDNGSGFTVAMEAARILMKAGARPKRTIMFHLWAAEERGILGSFSWVKRNMDKMDKISAVFNRDSGTNCIVGVRISEAMKEDFEQISAPLKDLNPKYPFTLNTGRRRRRPTRPRGSDHSVFAMQGVPTPGWRTEGTHRYRRTWHTVYDTYNEVVPEYQEHSVIASAIIVYGVANLDHLLSREGYFLEETGNVER